MIFKELLQKVSIDDVVCYINNHYEDEKKFEEDYRRMYASLLNSEPNIDSDLLLYMALVLPIFGDEKEYFDVSGYSFEEEVSYAIEFTPWNEWLGMKVAENSIKEYGAVTFVAECLREMSFISFEEACISEKVNQLEDICKEIESGEAKLIPAEEVFENLRNKYGFETPTKKTVEEREADRKRYEEISEKNLKTIKKIVGQE